MRPVRAKALFINAFALQGVLLFYEFYWALPFRHAPMAVGSARFDLTN